MDKQRKTLLLAAIFAWSGLHEAPGMPAQQDSFERVAGVVQARMKEHGVPGVALGILHRDNSQTRGFGVTSVENPLPVTDETLFQVGSISKTFTGTLVMSLVGMGKLDLDAPVRRYLPAFRVRDEAATRGATLRTLLTHMGGWEGDVFLDTGNGDDALERAVESLADVEQVAPFNSFYSYNNAGFYVASRLIELAAGKTYEQALQDLLLKPLGLKQTFIFPTDVMIHRFVVGHGGAPGKVEVRKRWALARAAHGMGGVTASVKDLLQYGRFHLGDGTAPDGTRIMSKERLQEMHATQLVKQGMDDEMAVTWHVSNEGGIRQLSHGGSTVGQQAFLLLVPAREFAVAVLTNSGAGSRLYREVVRAALREYLAVTIRDPEPVTVPVAELGRFAGRYTRPFADMTVEPEGNRLAIRTFNKRGFPTPDTPIPPPDPPSYYAFYATDRLIALEGPAKGNRAEVLRRADGSVGWIRVGGRLFRKP